MLTSIFSRLVITFGDCALPTRTLVEEVVFGILLILPISTFVGHVTMRLAMLPFPKFRPDVWNTLVRLLVADALMEVLLPSIQCLPLDAHHDHHHHDTTTTTTTMLEPGYSMTHFLQSWGFQCQATTTTFALTPTATGILFATRLFFVCCGVHLGESYRPIALTGGIACGKSTVAHLLVHGVGGGGGTTSLEPSVSDGSVYLVDTDTIAHNVLLPNTPDSVYDQVVQVFEQDDILVDNRHTPMDTTPPLLDRRKLGAVIFANASKRKLLNHITHPRILYVMLKRMLWGTYVSNKDVVVCDVPLLYEGPLFLRWIFGLTICVACEERLQRQRLQQRNSDLSPQECQERIASQIPVAQKVQWANFVIFNNASVEELEEQVEQIREEMMHRIYGVGLSLLQLLIIIGGSVPVAVLSKLYSMKYEASDSSSTSTSGEGDL
jgi:dephospho-CoA kinase